MDLKDINVKSLRSRQGAKWKAYSEPIIPAWVADMDFPVAHAISEALFERVQSSDLGYPVAFEKTKLPELLCQRLMERFSWSVNPKELLSITDVVQGLYQAIFTFSRKGEGIIIQTPIYPPFLQSVQELNRKSVINPLRLLEHGYEIDLENLDQCLLKKPRLLMLCNPHNPTGRVFSRKELEEVALFACRNDLIILSDEIHADLVLDTQPHIPIASIDGEVAARTVTFMSASKSFNIAGLCLAFAHFGDQKLLKIFDELPRHMAGSHNTLSLVAVEAAWTKGEKWLNQVLETLRRNRSDLKERIDRSWPQVRFFPGEATYLAWMDMRSIGPGKKMARFFLDRAQVALSEGEMFGREGEGFVRLNFATSPKVLSDILNRMDGVIQGF